MKSAVSSLDRKGVCLLLTLSFLISCLPSVGAAYEGGFSDVGEEAWFYSFVSDLSAQGVISGYPDGTFRPDSNVTVGETLALVLLAAGYEADPIEGEHWSRGFAKLAEDKGFLNRSLTGDPDADMTRLQVARLAAKALKLLPTAAKEGSVFADTDDGYVNVLYRKNVLAGSLEGDIRVFKPDDPISRSEISAIIWNIRNTDVHAGQIETKDYYIDILEGVPVSAYDPEGFRWDEDGFADYIGPGIETSTGIDVSSFQGEIDWERVRDAGIDFAIIRVGGRGYSAGALYEDRLFEDNIRGALDAGIAVGAYFFSQAITAEEAREEAGYTLEKLAPYRDEIALPVVFDWEVNGSGYRTYNLDADTLGECANAFCAVIRDAGYDTMVYFNQFAGYRRYDLRQVLDHQFWYAQYPVTPSAPAFYYDFNMWQYSSNGLIDGIEGRVDMNLWLIKTAPPQEQEPPVQEFLPETAQNG